MTTTVSINSCKKRLAILWFSFGLVLFVLLILQSAFGKFGPKVEEAWAWFLPTLMPTLSLIVGVLVLEMVSSKPKDKQIDPFLFRLIFSLSAIYLVLVALIPLMQPFTETTTVELMKRSNLWLGPLQGVVTAALGAFFIKGAREG